MDNDINENGEDDINDEKRKDSSEKEEVREENDKSSEVDRAKDECKIGCYQMSYYAHIFKSKLLELGIGV
mgnify:CR=1 FL=1